MKISRTVGTVSEIMSLFIQNSASTTGAGLTSLVSSDLNAYYCRNDQATATVISLVSFTAGTFSSGGFVAIDNTNMPGWYQFCPPNAVFTSGRSAAVHLKGATNMAPLPIEIELTAWDNQNAVSGGMSRIDTTTSSRMATFTLPTNFSSFSLDSSGRVDVSKWFGGAIVTPSVTGIPITDVKYVLGTAVTEGGAGRLAAGFSTYFDVAAPTSTMNQITLVDRATTAGTVSNVTLTDRATTAGTVSLVLTATTVSNVVLTDRATTAGTVSLVLTATTVSNVVLTDRATTVGTVSLVLTATTVSSVVALASAYDFAKGTAAMTESYAANTVTPTPVQALYGIHQMLMGFAIAGTTITVRKLDNSSVAFAVLMDSATTPTSATRP